ncbi:MAG TPA: hypothetical protein VKU41_23265, partial [Polyangiaceae bacterium]|nr:hypothetical protein [Polyangiaceae bacterium]
LADDQPSQPGRRSPAAAVLRLTPLFLLPVAPWLLRSWLVTGNPVFPVFARWIPSRDFSPQTSAKFDAYNRYMLWGTRFAAHWSLGRRRALLLALGAAAIFVAGIAFTRIRSRFARATLVIATATVLIQLFAAGIYVRYWIPVMAILTLPLAALVDSAVRGSKRWLVLTAGAALGAVSLARQGLRSVGDDVPGLVASAIGVRDERSFLERHLPLFPLYERVNHAFPSESRLMLVSYCAGFYVDRMTYCADIPQDSLSYASWQTFLSDARRLGVTHVLAPTSLAAGQPLTSTTTGSVSALVQEQESEHVGRLLKERGHLIATAADEGLFEVNLDDGLDPHAP